MRLLTRRSAIGPVAGLCLGATAAAQRPDTLRAVALEPLTVSVTRGEVPADSLPYTTTVVRRERIARARPTWGLDEALGLVPGVFVANRYNFSLDQRVAIRGFGSRSAFAVRGVRILIDGVPQTLPDGQGQLTNLELGIVERIEVLHGPASALHGNAAGGVISVTTGIVAPEYWTQDVRVVAGAFDRQLDRTWHKVHVGTAFRVGRGAARVHAARLVYAGERDYSAADLRSAGVRLTLPLGTGWTLTTAADVGDQPKAENPGALTLAELAANRDSAAAANLTQRAGKNVSQIQGAATLRRRLSGGGELAVTGFALTRDLDNPQTFAWIRIARTVWGARAVWTRAVAGGRHHLTSGFDVQVQRDDRLNLQNAAGTPDSVRLLDQDETVRELGPFVHARVALGAGIGIAAGVRLDVVRFSARDRLVTPSNPDDSGERTLAAPSGSLGVTWAAGAGTVLYANVASSFETPTTTELTNAPGGAGGFNAELGPQRAWTLEGGLRWTGHRWRGTVAAFHGDVRDALIPFEVPSAPQRRFYRNAGRATHRGVEVALEARPQRWLTAAASYAFSSFRYREYVVTTGAGPRSLAGRPLPGVPAHRAQFAIELRPATGGPWLDLELVHTGSVLVDDTLDTRAGSWWQGNVRGGLETNLGGWRIAPFVGVQNLTNGHAVGSVVVNAARGRYYEPAPGRHGYLGVTLSGGR